MRPQIPAPKSRAYVLKKDTIMVVNFMFGQRAYVLRAGETCSYFRNSDCFTFESRDGITLYYDRDIVESLPEFFEPIKGA